MSNFVFYASTTKILPRPVFCDKNATIIGKSISLHSNTTKTRGVRSGGTGGDIATPIFLKIGKIRACSNHNISWSNYHSAVPRISGV